MHISNQNLSQKIAAARTVLDAHVRDIVNWHFSPEPGCPFWLEFAENLDFDSTQRKFLNFNLKI